MSNLGFHLGIGLVALPGPFANQCNLLQKKRPSANAIGKARGRLLLTKSQSPGVLPGAQLLTAAINNR